MKLAKKTELYPTPHTDESPSEYADRLGVIYTSKVTLDHKKNLGQYFTPAKVANFMGEFGEIFKSSIRILDPGCGIGILSCSLIEKLVSSNSNIKEINLVAFENDNEILSYTDLCFSYLFLWLEEKGIIFSYFLCKNDFILHNSAILKSADSEDEEKYDLIITNPPYFKLNKDDARAVAAKSIINGQTNIYSIFLIISARLLSENGKLIFITPRSFTSGSYFKLFREKFLSMMDLTKIHLFISRKDAFERDKVLQENIIVVSEKKSAPIPNQLEIDFPDQSASTIYISYSHGINDLDSRNIKEYVITELVNLQSDQKIIHIPIVPNDEKAIQIFKLWTHNLASFDLKVSTGPVVDFRSLDFIKEKASKHSVPLIYLHNVNKMQFQWPLEKRNKGKIKGEYIISNELSSSRLVANKDYILMRRFSSKDDNSKLIASPYFAKWLSEYSLIGIENHLNYIYRENKDFKEVEILGLSGLLNSRLFDIYFRTFNGNINVSATELRDLPLPPASDIIKIGKKMIKLVSYDQDAINNIVESHFKIIFN
ncbi:Eco57I restriction-modification methylase domain-containing protein [Chitinophaga sp. MM2321]|uniref:Eco57I restriction-modification methylase domain-containing protein n=1 Tax=Chitinophaga sp. MM2321 TaxID=3137178 RepID=UPI0032D58250